jgi:eukaryotic-like serine/threonine-protein kinase
MKTTPSYALRAGSRIGRYEIVGALARGGMAEIYLARLRGIEGYEKLVALKRMLPELSRSAAFQGMFLDEARLAARLDHGNIVQTYELGWDGDSYYFTMEYVAGDDVRRLMRRCWAAGFDFPLEHALKIAIDAAAGLHAAHESTGPDGLHAGVVHRDASPSNLLVSFDGCVKVTDFGVAKASRRQTESRIGQLKGKVSYMSPEQCRGLPIDRRSDIFTLGIVLYELTCGGRLFTGKSEYEILHEVATGAIPPPSGRARGYLPELEEVVMRCLARQPDDRYQTAAQLQLELEAIARHYVLETSSLALGQFVRTMFPRRYERWRSLLVSRPPRRRLRTAAGTPPPPLERTAPGAPLDQEEIVELTADAVIEPVDLADVLEVIDVLDAGEHSVPTRPAPAGTPVPDEARRPPGRWQRPGTVRGFGPTRLPPGTIGTIKRTARG